MTRRAEVQVFAFDEPDLKRTLEAYANCTTPAGWSVTYKACVTPRSAIASAPAALHEVVHRQVDIARNHDVFELVETPPGKLASRNHAHSLAADAGVDVLVVGDADAPPLTMDYLDQLLAPFADDVVATNARPVAPWTPIGAATNLMGWAHDVAVPHMNGQGHALRATAWEAAGPFVVDDQTDNPEVRLEEEFALRRRLDELGNVVDVADARVHNDTRRTRCKLEAVLPGDPSPYCQRLGVETFAPERP